MTGLIQTELTFIGRLLLLFFALAGVSAVLAQRSEEVIRVDTELAGFEVTVTDEKGLPVEGLTANDFRIFENGVMRNVDFFQPLVGHDRRRPLLVVFALDVSGSMTEPELEKLSSAMERFIKQLADGNTYFAVMTFAMRVQLLQQFTNVPDRVSRALSRIGRNRSGRSTHAYDAVDDAIRLIERRSPRQIRGLAPKRTVVVITDGFPVGDVVSPGTVIERANNAEVSVYSLIMPSFSRLQRRPLMTPFEASGLVEQTGGYSFYANEKEIDQVMARLADQVKGSYILAFYPEDAAKMTGEFREVRIESGKGFQVRQNRPGFHLK